MIPEPKPYKKQDSIIDLNHKIPLASILPRILKVRETLSSFGLESYNKSIVKKACDELFGEKEPDNGEPLFKLHSS